MKMSPAIQDCYKSCIEFSLSVEAAENLKLDKVCVS